MASHDEDEVNLPWGKFSYATDGLATTCYMEGVSKKLYKDRHRQPHGKKLLFRVEIPARCFVLSVTVKLPNAPQSALVALDYMEIESSLKNGEYETVYDGYTELMKQREATDAVVKEEKSANRTAHTESTESSSGGSPTAVDHSVSRPVLDSKTQRSRKKTMPVRRAADVLRITLIDVEDPTESSASSPSVQNDSGYEGSDNGDLRILSVAVNGYVRGQTPAPNRLKVLLDCSAKLGLDAFMTDRAEVDALLGLAMLGHRRFRQAGELLQRASELTLQIANEEAEKGEGSEEAIAWAAQLNLLSAHAYFEHVPQANDGIIRLVHVAAATGFRSGTKGNHAARDILKLNEEFLDLRTELLSMRESLITMLVQFLGESCSVAVKLASAGMLEFMFEQLGCAIAYHMAEILNQVLRSYPSCIPFGARERAAAASFSYDSMEDCFDRLIDLCCRLFPLTEHTVLLKLYENTLIPVFLDGFHESEYLFYNEDAEQAENATTTAAAQTLRIIYLALKILGSDVRIPSSLLSRLLKILIAEKGNARTPIVLRRAALHAWDAVSTSLVQAASGCNVKVFGDHLSSLKDYLPNLLLETERKNFQYKGIDEEDDNELEITKEEYVTPVNSQVFEGILEKRRKRIELVDRHTLRRLIRLIHDICERMQPTKDEDDRSQDITLSLLEAIGDGISSLLMSGLIDVSYHQAASGGNGTGEPYEFGLLSNQLLVVSEILDDLFNCFWAAVRLLPGTAASEVVRTAPVRAVLGWCVDRMAHSAPPKGMLRLLSVAAKGLQSEFNKPMYDLPSVPSAPHEATYLGIYRAVIQWFPQATQEEAFDLLDILLENVADDLMANDLALLVKGLGNQSEALQGRTESSLGKVAELVASNVPRRLDLALSSLKALEDPKHGSQRISDGFPSTSKSNSSSFPRKMHLSGTQAHPDPTAQSFYLHVVLASCFDLFDGLARAVSQRAGPSFMGEKIDAFVEHAALCVRCLQACARTRRHREYVGAKLGDIFGTCLAMQDHGDGRVRLAGFEIFAASLDVLFQAQKSFALLPEQAVVPGNGATVASSLTSIATQGGGYENQNGPSDVTVFENDSVPLVHVSSHPTPGLDFARSMSLPISRSASKNDFVSHELQHDGPEGNEDTERERKMRTIFAEGGSCAFQGDDTTNVRFDYEERGWQILCHFVTASLGIGKYVDFVVQRACLEYLKGCMLSALRGRSSGARVIAFEHIELLWEAVNRLIGSPWRTLNGLAMWVICTILNVAIYSSVMSRKRGLTKQRGVQLNEFLAKQVFPRAESMLKHSSRETRLWGMKLLEVYIKARDMNGNVLQITPVVPALVLRGLEQLQLDWSEDVREAVRSLCEIHHSALNKKGTSQMQSFTAQAQSFMTMRRYHLDEFEGTEANQVELWFPPIPRQVPASDMELYCRPLEAFANTEIEGGEETELAKTADEDNETEYDEGYDYDEDIEEEEEEEEEVETEEAFSTPAEHETQEVHDDQNELEVDPSVPVDMRENNEVEVPESVERVDSKFESLDARSSDGTILKGHVEMGEAGGLDDEDDEEDHEFTVMPQADAADRLGPQLVTQISDPSDNVLTGAGSFGAEQVNDDLEEEEEEEVVNVTDEDDVLVDVDSMPAEKKLSSHYSIPKPELNPDLEEGRHVLRRKGSFTSRPSVGIPIEEGDVPRLARRRSVDLSLMTPLIETSSDRELVESRASSQSLSPRLSRRKSLKSPTSSPRPPEASRTRSGEQQSLRDGLRGKETGEEVTSPSSRLRRRSSRGVDLTDEQSTEAKNRRTSRESSKDGYIGGAFLDLSPKHRQVPRGITLEDDAGFDSINESRPTATPHAGQRTSETGRPSSKARLSSKSGRRLPRAPAFVKGGGPQRRLPAPLPIGNSSNSGVKSDEPYLRSTSSSSLEGASGQGGSSNPIVSSRGRLPRARSLVGKSRLEARKEEAEDKPDKSYRYSRREPRTSLSILSEDFDPDIMGENSDLVVDDVSDLQNQMRIGTPTAEAALGRRTLADDEPSSNYKRRASKRSVGNSLHFRSLLDQFEPRPEDEGSKSKGTSSLQNGSPSMDT